MDKVTTPRHTRNQSSRNGIHAHTKHKKNTNVREDVQNQRRDMLQAPNNCCNRRNFALVQKSRANPEWARHRLPSECAVELLIFLRCETVHDKHRTLHGFRVLVHKVRVADPSSGLPLCVNCVPVPGVQLHQQVVSTCQRQTQSASQR